jgi:hypothetical protein
MGKLAMVRLLLATGAFRACYQKLDAENGAAAKQLRDEVAHPDGFAGLDWRRTGFAAYLSLWRRAGVMGGSWMRLQWIGRSSRRSTCRALLVPEGVPRAPSLKTVELSRDEHRN